jgi:fatty acid desaturase
MENVLQTSGESSPETLVDAASMPQKKPRQIRWYRTPIDAELLRELSRRSDTLGALQTLGYLGSYATTAGLALYSLGRWHWSATALFVFLHGMVTAFMINGVHELGHNTVFRSRWLNAVFLRILAFLGWINFQMFGQSHGRHHAYTLHPPDDLEVVLPIRLAVWHFLEQGFVNPRGLYRALRDTIRIARGHFKGEWELTLYPTLDPLRRRPAVRWARTLLLGHFLITAISLAAGWWMIPILITLGPFYGGWLFFLCNNTQHIGLMNNVPDFRLCCRTCTLNPLFRMLYWQMNYHTEHHMYPTVPCYRLGKLHRAIVADMPPCPHGLMQTWREIARILRQQRADATFQHVMMIPVRPPATGNF